MSLKLLWKNTTLWRNLVQWSFFCWVLYLGIRFGQFVQHFTSQGVAPFVARPSGVDGFLPIGGLASLKLLLTTGQFDTLHPAALVLLVTFLLMSLAAKKSFCSWLCPVGTLSEGAWKLGTRLFGRSLTLWRWLDVLLRGTKYLLLAFFVKIVLIDMPSAAIAAFLKAPYWALSDVKMLNFFTQMSLTTLIVLTVVIVLSLFIKNFWCRYLCPYGALLGLVSLVSPFKIRRDTTTCTNCRACTRTCPSRISVHSRTRVMNAECTGCLSCVEACPHNSLAMSMRGLRNPLPRWMFPVVLLTLYAAGVGLGMVSGHWESALVYQDYQRLIPMIDLLSH
ncbi:MAG: 4Fe-4S binding protein [Desulfuromonadales bacterium]|nr:4Fe-4S binding protein [Desulfuromonadales bacterium]MBN2790916.1 4Fe-4S binding protein [Desulfuromonadales bacterium]